MQKEKEVNITKVKFLKLFRNAYDNEPCREFLFHDIYYTGCEIKEMMISLMTSLKSEGINEVFVYFNMPRFMEKSSEVLSRIKHFKRLVKQHIVIISSMYDINFYFEE